MGYKREGKEVYKGRGGGEEGGGRHRGEARGEGFPQRESNIQKQERMLRRGGSVMREGSLQRESNTRQCTVLLHLCCTEDELTTRQIATSDPGGLEVSM